MKKPRDKGFHAMIYSPGWMLILIYCLSLSSYTCQKDKTPLAIKILETATRVGISGEYLIYNIEFICDEPITSFRIEQFHPKYGSVTIFDSVPPTKKFKWYYLVPFVDDQTKVTLTFSATSASYSNDVPRSVLITNNEMPLTEYAGNAFYSNLSGKPNAFMIQGLQAVFYDSLSALKPDFADNSIDSVHLNDLSREWISPSGLLFSRLNDFNYAQATSRSVKEAYKIAVKYNVVKNLTSDDILVFGNNTEAEGTIRFTQIIDADSTIDDKYLFNIKLVD